MKDKDKKRDHDENKMTGFFDKDTEFRGDLAFKGSFRIDGRFKGTIVSDSMLVIGEQGVVEADVKVGYLVINGEIRGTIMAEDKVEIHGRARVFGTIMTPKLIVEEGALLEAKCQTGEIAGSQPAPLPRKGGNRLLTSAAAVIPARLPVDAVSGKTSGPDPGEADDPVGLRGGPAGRVSSTGSSSPPMTARIYDAARGLRGGSQDDVGGPRLGDRKGRGGGAKPWMTISSSISRATNR